MKFLQIVTGERNYVLPSIEACLSAGNGRFNSKSNAIRIHEWIRDIQGVAPVLRSVDTDEERPLGIALDVFPVRNAPGIIFEMEQLAVGMPHYRDMFGEAMIIAESYEQSDRIKILMEKKTKMDQVMDRMALYTASMIYSSIEIPSRFVFHDIRTLDYLVAMVATQRRQVWYETSSPINWDVSQNQYRLQDLTHSVAKLHQASYEGAWRPAEDYALDLSLLDAKFFCQVAMAWSNACEQKIVQAYVDVEETQVFHWARAILNAAKTEADSMRLNPSPQNVVSLFTKSK